MIRGTLAMTLAAFSLLQPAMNAIAEGAQAAASADNSQVKVRQQMESAGVGSQVEVTLHDRNKLSGRLISVNADDFNVQTGEGQDAVSHLVRFEDVRSVKVFQQQAATSTPQSRSKLSKRGKMMLIVGAVVLVFGVVTFATTKGP
jgi:hypothetical protein